ncbi:MAG: 2-hydroxyacyl-CoA dehydratase family protein [Firmicutes bacterium]|nr:2-hydroxyacyl-CoA dehydratase family protein [Bacillota bacterium]
MEIDKANEILNNLEKIANQPYEKAKEWKERTGNKVVGVYPMHYPEELIHAAGILPVLLQTSDEAVTEGRSYYYPFFCALACSVIDQAAKGYLKFMDGVISGDYCIQVVGSGECVEVILPLA